MNTITLTARQRAIWDWVDRFIKENKRSPTLQQIADGMKMKSRVAVRNHLLAIETKGALIYRGRMTEEGETSITLISPEPLSYALSLLQCLKEIDDTFIACLKLQSELPLSEIDRLQCLIRKFTQGNYPKRDLEPITEKG